MAKLLEYENGKLIKFRQPKFKKVPETSLDDDENTGNGGKLMFHGGNILQVGRNLTGCMNDNTP